MPDSHGAKLLHPSSVTAEVRADDYKINYGGVVGHLVGFAIGIVVAVVVVALVPPIYNRRTGRLLRTLPAGAWGAACVDARYARSWRVLIADSSGVRLVKSNGKPARSWSWAEIATVDPGRVRIGVTRRAGVVLHLRDGSQVGLLMPSHNTLSYPRPLAGQAVAELRRRQPAEQG